MSKHKNGSISNLNKNKKEEKIIVEIKWKDILETSFCFLFLLVFESIICFFVFDCFLENPKDIQFQCLSLCIFIIPTLFLCLYYMQKI